MKTLNFFTFSGLIEGTGEWHCSAVLSSAPHTSVNIPEGVQAQWVRVMPPFCLCNTESVIFCVVYHPPCAATAQLLINNIIDVVGALRMRFPVAKLVICGDLNLLDVSDILHHCGFAPPIIKQSLTLSSQT